jgi:hypothetical protein
MKARMKMRDVLITVIVVLGAASDCSRVSAA